MRQIESAARRLLARKGRHPDSVEEGLTLALAAGAQCRAPSASLLADLLPSRRGASPSSEAESAGRPARVACLGGTRRGPVPSARALAAAALLPLASALALPAAADAQTETTLVSNIGQGSTSSVTRSARVAQVFTTGSNESGYTLTGVDIVSTGVAYRVEFCGTNAAVPTYCSSYGFSAESTVTTLATQSFSASLSPFQLDSETTYAVALFPSGDSQGYSVTTLDAEDAAKADGWSIADGSFFEDSEGNWESSVDALRIAIKGTVAPTPAANVAPASASEGEDVTFTVTLTEAYTSQRPRLAWTASIESGDTAIRADLGPGHLLNGRVSWIGGEGTTGTFSVPTAEDTVLEGDETFTVTLEAVEGVKLGENFTAKGTILNDDVPDTTAPSLTGVITHANGRIIDLVFDDSVVIGPVGQTPVQQADPVPEAYADAFSLSIDGVAVNTEPPYDRPRGRPTEVRLRLAGRKDWPPDQGLVRTVIDIKLSTSSG